MALDNKFNITDSAELARVEEKISKKKAVELFENGYLDNSRSEVLNPVLLDFRVKEAIKNTNKKEALIAFGCL